MTGHADYDQSTTPILYELSWYNSRLITLSLIKIETFSLWQFKDIFLFFKPLENNSI